MSILSCCRKRKAAYEAALQAYEADRNARSADQSDRNPGAQQQSGRESDTADAHTRANPAVPAAVAADGMPDEQDAAASPAADREVSAASDDSYVVVQHATGDAPEGSTSQHSATTATGDALAGAQCSAEAATESKTYQADQLRQQGNAAFGASNPDEAMRCWRQALYLNPSDARIHNNVSMVLLKQGKLELALEAANSAVALKGGSTAAVASKSYLRRGNVLKQLGKDVSAANDFDTAKALDSSFAVLPASSIASSCNVASNAQQAQAKVVAESISAEGQQRAMLDARSTADTEVIAPSAESSSGSMGASFVHVDNSAAQQQQQEQEEHGNEPQEGTKYKLSELPCSVEVQEDGTHIKRYHLQQRKTDGSDARAPAKRAAEGSDAAQGGTAGKAAAARGAQADCERPAPVNGNRAPAKDNQASASASQASGAPGAQQQQHQQESCLPAAAADAAQSASAMPETGSKAATSPREALVKEAIASSKSASVQAANRPQPRRVADIKSSCKALSSDVAEVASYIAAIPTAQYHRIIKKDIDAQTVEAFAVALDAKKDQDPEWCRKCLNALSEVPRFSSVSAMVKPRVKQQLVAAEAAVKSGSCMRL